MSCDQCPGILKQYQLLEVTEHDVFLKEIALWFQSYSVFLKILQGTVLIIEACRDGLKMFVTNHCEPGWVPSAHSLIY